MDMLSDGNKKYRYRKDIRVLTWGLPPISTCPGAGLCKAFCYARAGRMLMGSATTAMARRFAQSKRADFVPKMIAELARRKCDMVRLHDSGDFYNQAYLYKWIEVAKAYPGKVFFAYTKMVPMIQSMMRTGLIPSNLKIIFSMGGKWDMDINIGNFDHAQVFETKAKMLKAGYRESPDNLPLSFHGGKKEGFVYHGVMKWATCMKRADALGLSRTANTGGMKCQQDAR